jgi:methylthioribose-1-phosphate isomerase
VYWDSLDSSLVLLDQRHLPVKIEYIRCKSPADTADAIHKMIVRGAPAIGAAGAFGMVLGALKFNRNLNLDQFLMDLHNTKDTLDRARPTAVNLSWATNRMIQVAEFVAKATNSIDRVVDALLLESQALSDEDVDINKRLGKFGAELFPDTVEVLHHCNTGHLATVKYGTALGIIYSAAEMGKKIHVWVDETRPRLQGARLTAWELMQCGIPLHLIADSVAGHLMSKGKIDAIVFGADRVSRNGDVANKIGTYSICVLGKENSIPRYAAVPTSTIDLDTPNGDQIVIEERNSEEVTEIQGQRVAPENVPVYNPAFDVTPARYLTAIVTEEGVCYPPFEKSLAEAKQKAEVRMSELRAKRLNSYLK